MQVTAGFDFRHSNQLMYHSKGVSARGSMENLIAQFYLKNLAFHIKQSKTYYEFGQKIWLGTFHAMVLAQNGGKICTNKQFLFAYVDDFYFHCRVICTLLKRGQLQPPSSPHALVVIIATHHRQNP